MVDTFSMPDILNEVVVYGLTDLVRKGAGFSKQNSGFFASSLCCLMSFVDMSCSSSGSDVAYIGSSEQTP